MSNSSLAQTCGRCGSVLEHRVVAKTKDNRLVELLRCNFCPQDSTKAGWPYDLKHEAGMDIIHLPLLEFHQQQAIMEAAEHGRYALLEFLAYRLVQPYLMHRLSGLKLVKTGETFTSIVLELRNPLRTIADAIRAGLPLRVEADPEIENGLLIHPNSGPPLRLSRRSLRDMEYEYGTDNGPSTTRGL